MIKPDGVRRGLIGAVIDTVEFNGLRVVGLRMQQLTVGQARAIYHVHEGKSFYTDLIEFTCSGPVVLMAIEGGGAVDEYRNLVEENLRPRLRRPDDPLRENVVHGSDSPEAAAEELNLFFPGMK
jgi:nucleoside-diphosphate kinase